jgi:hypothetical protein
VTKAQIAKITHDFLAKVATNAKLRATLERTLKAGDKKGDHDTRVAALITKTLKLETPLSARDMSGVKLTLQGLHARMTSDVWNILAGGPYDSPGDDHD